MKLIKKKGCSIFIIIVLLVAVLLGLIVYFDVKYHSYYNVSYCNKEIVLSGKFWDKKKLKFNSFVIKLPTEENRQRSHFKVAIKMDDKIYELSKLTPSVLDKLKTRAVKKDSEMEWYYIEASSEIKPYYGLSCGVKNNKVVELDFIISHPIESVWGKITPCPISFIFNNSKPIIFPVNKKTIDDILGKEENMERYLDFP